MSLQDSEILGIVNYVGHALVEAGRSDLCTLWARVEAKQWTGIGSGLYFRFLLPAAQHRLALRNEEQIVKELRSLVFTAMRGLSYHDAVRFEFVPILNDDESWRDAFHVDCAALRQA